MAKKKHVVQLYLNDKEYEFLKRTANHLNKSLAQTMIYFADFHQRMLEEEQEINRVIIKGMEISDHPFDDYDEY